MEREMMQDHIPDTTPFIRLRGVVKHYQGAAGAVVALRGIDLDVQRGEFLVVLGKSGSGKTTLVNLLTGLDRVTAGEVWVAATPVHRLSAGAAARWRGQTIGVVFQAFELLPTLTLLQNVMLPMDFARHGAPARQRERALALLAELELADHAHKPPSAISGGQQQRVAIARALANDPPLVVADEPTGSLDSATAATVVQIFTRLVAQGKTVVLVTHDHDVARQATRVITLSDGELTGG